MPVKNLDFFTVIAIPLYHLLGQRIGNGFEIAKPSPLFRKRVHAGARMDITDNEIIASLMR